MFLKETAISVGAGAVAGESNWGGDNNTIENTVDLQRIEHRWLVYHGYFELVFGSLEHSIATDSIIFAII